MVSNTERIRVHTVELNVSTDQIRYAARQYGIELPVLRKKTPLTERLLSRYTREELANANQHQLAREERTSQPSVSAAFKQLGIISNYDRTSQCKDDECLQVKEYIQSNRPVSVAAAIEALDLNVTRGTFYAFAKREGFPLERSNGRPKGAKNKPKVA